MSDDRRALKCEEFRERFVYLWDGEGDPADRALLLAHIESCAACTAEWESFRETAGAVRAIAAEPTEEEHRAIVDAAEPILEGIRARREEARPALSRPGRSRRLVRYALTAAAAAILFFLVQNLTGPESPALRSTDVVHYYETGGSPLLFGGAVFSTPR